MRGAEPVRLGADRLAGADCKAGGMALMSSDAADRPWKSAAEIVRGRAVTMASVGMIHNFSRCLV